MEYGDKRYFIVNGPGFAEPFVERSLTGLVLATLPEDERTPPPGLSDQETESQTSGPGTSGRIGRGEIASPLSFLLR